MTEGDFLNIEDLDEETINQILGLGGLEDKKSSLAQQLEQAQSIRNRPGPEGRGYAGVYTAANPLEHITSAVQGIKAGRDMDRIIEQQNELLQEQTAGRKQFLDALMKQKNVIRGTPINPSEYGPQPFDPNGIY